jgi:hypothetical protein
LPVQGEHIFSLSKALDTSTGNLRKTNLGCLTSRPLFLKHGPKLLPQFGRVLMPVYGAGMERGKLYNLIGSAGNGDAARLIGRKAAAINHFSCFRHGNSSI